MKLLRRDPDKGYIDTLLWVPKRHVNLEGTKRALTFTFIDAKNVVTLSLYREAEHHLLVPREFWEVRDLPFEVIDARPTSYPRVSLGSRITLDFINKNEKTQADALHALLKARGGVLQLACVAGDTKLNLNRGGKGFTVTIEAAYARLHKPGRYAWNKTIPTLIRAKMENRIGLHPIESIIFRGWRQTIELVLEDGKKLRVTEDHEILTPSGFVPAGQLKIHQEVVVDGVRRKSIRKPKPRYKRLSWYPSHPFARRDGRNIHLEEHRAVAEAALNDLTLAEFRERCRHGKVKGLRFIDPAKFHVHHRDEDTANNASSNLEVLPIEEHLSGHRPGAGAFGYGIPTPARIKAINQGRFEKVYDVACADPHHNFVASGIVVHNCGKGKTVVALELAARLGVPTIVVVDNTHLLGQWKAAILGDGKGKPALLGLSPKDVGLIQAEVFDWKKPIVLTTYQTLSARAEFMPEEVRRWFGLIIWDEAHHVAAPTFARTADLFYGYRLGLTATPVRDDGLHIIYDFHIGKVIYKDLKQELRPRVYFLWTGLSLDMENAKTKQDACDKNGELHLSKLSTFFGQWKERLDIILTEVLKAVEAGRKVLVLSNSVDECINLLSIWSSYPEAYTDIPIPTEKEVGENVPPMSLDEKTYNKVVRKLHQLKAQLTDQALNPVKKTNLQAMKTELEHQLRMHEVAKKIEALLRKRQRAYLQDLLAHVTDAGLMIHKVKPTERAEMLRTKKVTFAITKYGREGLDEQLLDTVIVCEPMSSRNGLQQVMGRILRVKEGKKFPVIVFLEDNIGPMIGMCKKLRRHLREWPLEENGPYEYEMLGHPATMRPRGKAWTTNSLRVPGQL